MASIPQQMKYLFAAYFEDGTIIEQTQEDKSEHKEGKSAFTDVWDKSQDVPLIQFSLRGRDSEGNQYIAAIDFESGYFYVNGVEFKLEDAPLSDRKVIYFREISQHQIVGEEAQTPYFSCYILGYEGKDEDGKVHKKVLRLAA